MPLFYIGIGIFAVSWIAGFVGTFRRTWVPKSEPWYGKLYAYTLLFFGWPFVLLYMRDRE